ncbi:hypothetical protein C8R44DRAFT_444000 [Mycena epipterygia]|nr:hypothetical protein C8R44DRAFT_444000 [Mycena epipterygia]
MTTHPILPTDLEREIFEAAAIMHPQTIPVLLRVARRVLIWIEPFLYRVTLVQTGHSMSDAVRRAMKTKPPSFFENGIRHLFLAQTLPRWSEEDVCGLLRLCPRLVSLTIISGFAYHPLLPILLGMQQLRRWNGSLKDLFGGSSAVDLSHPAFRNITHMDIFDVVDDIILPGLATLPALTHLCLNDDVGLRVLQRILEQCMHLQVLVNLWYISDSEDAREIANSPPVTDVRFVVIVFSDFWTDLEIGARGGTDFWAAADVFIVRKRRGEIDASCYWVAY